VDGNNLDDREQAKKNAWISFSYFLGSLLAIASVCLVLTTAVFVFSANKTTGTVTQVYRSASSGQHSAVHVSISFFRATNGSNFLNSSPSAAFGKVKQFLFCSIPAIRPAPGLALFGASGTCQLFLRFLPCLHTPRPTPTATATSLSVFPQPAS
jgi:hypothetical protein